MIKTIKDYEKEKELKKENKKVKEKKESFFEYMKDLFIIFLEFLKIGSVSFGGGLAIVKVYECEFVDKKKWLTKEELYDYYFLSQVTPGVIICSTSAYIGYKLKKEGGLIAAIIGVIIPAITIISVIALCLRNFMEYPIVHSILKGMNIAVLAVLISINVDLFLKNVTNVWYFLLFLAALISMKLFNVSVLIIALVSALLGILALDKNVVKEYKKLKKETKNESEDKIND